MPTFEYEATVKETNGKKNGEELTEWGTVVAPTQTGAEDKLRHLGLVPVRLVPLRGLKSFFKSFAADVK